MNHARRHAEISALRKDHLFLRDEDEDCVSPDPANTVADRINALLNSSGPSYVLSLCPEKQYFIQSPLLFAAPQQEISTLGYPTDQARATLVVSGPVANGEGHTVAIDGTCASCSGVKLRNIQIDGTRDGAPPTKGGGNIEMGGANSDQLIEYVRTFNPRGWTCLHIAEGPLSCSNVTVQNNDIGPCGSDNFQEWADGISMSCQNSVVRNNMIESPTDGGIVLFGAPGTEVYNNTIWVVNQTLLGGVNMVDYDPWSGNYTGTVVRDNIFLGGFATDEPDANKGENSEDAIMKIGVAIGPRTWFGERYGKSVSFGGTVQNNQFSGAFSYAIAISSAREFTVQDNVLFGNTSFIGSRGPNCTDGDTVPTPAAFVMDTNNTQSLTTQSDFQTIADGDALTCVLPPDGGDYWPYGGNPTVDPTAEEDSSSGLSSGTTAGIIIGILAGVVFLGVASWYLRKWALERIESRRHFDTAKNSRRSYSKHI